MKKFYLEAKELLAIIASLQYAAEKIVESEQSLIPLAIKAEELANSFASVIDSVDPESVVEVKTKRKILYDITL